MKTACPMCGVDREHSEPHAGWCRIGKQERELQIWLAKSATKLREKLNMSKCVECGQPTGYHKVGCSENPTKISEDDGVLRSFNTGATRDTSEGKLDMGSFEIVTIGRRGFRWKSTKPQSGDITLNIGRQ